MTTLDFELAGFWSNFKHLGPGYISCLSCSVASEAVTKNDLALLFGTADYALLYKRCVLLLFTFGCVNVKFDRDLKCYALEPGHSVLSHIHTYGTAIHYEWIGRVWSPRKKCMLS